MKRIKVLFAALITMFLVNGFVFAQDTTLIVTDNGNVGIGNTSPVYKLDIEGGATPLRITGGGPQFQKFLFDVATGGFAILRVYDKDVNEDFRFATNGDSWLNGDGNVGIGTTSPQQKLEVDGNIRLTGAGEIGVGGTTNVLVLTGGTSVNAAEIDLFGSSNAFNPSHINLTTNNAIRMRVDQNGNVGIGTTSPVYKLDIEGGATPLRITGGGPQFQKFLFDVATGGFAIFRVYDKDVNEDFRFATNGDSWLNGDGNVGIGTTAPNHPLEMASGAHVTAGGVWTDASSRQYKENISNLTQMEAISALEKLNPVKFNYKSEREEEYVGFIAEDVPDLVATSDRKSLSPMNIVAVLTKVVQQ